MSDFKAYVTYKNIQFVLVVEEYDYHSAEKASYTYPGCEAALDVVSGYIELDGDVFEPNAADNELIALLENNNAELFSLVYVACDVHDKLLEHVLTTIKNFQY